MRLFAASSPPFRTDPDRQSVRAAEPARNQLTGSGQVAYACDPLYGVCVNTRALTVAVMVVTTVVAALGCSHTVSGNPQRATHEDGASARGYGYTPDRCGLLQDVTVQQIVGADQLVRPYSGAVCQYVLMKASTTIDLTYAWFETGRIDRERALAASNNAQISDIVVERREAFLARRSITGNACSATVATSPGVASWWVQIRGQWPTDPCQIAQTLLARTLSSEM